MHDFFPIYKESVSLGVFSAALERHPLQNRSPGKNDEKMFEISFLCDSLNPPN